jgi:hypothetical protein
MLTIIVGDTFEQNMPRCNILTATAFIVDAYKKDNNIKIISNFKIKGIKYVPIYKILGIDDSIWIDSYILLDFNLIKEKYYKYFYYYYLTLQHNRRNLTVYCCFPHLIYVPTIVKACSNSIIWCQYKKNNIQAVKFELNTLPRKHFIFNATQYLKYCDEKNKIKPIKIKVEKDK